MLGCRWVDLSTLERTNSSYLSDDYRELEDDIVGRLRWGDRELYGLIDTYPKAIDRFRPSASYHILDEQEMRLDPSMVVQNIAVAIFSMEQVEGRELFILGTQIRDWLIEIGRIDLKDTIKAWYQRTLIHCKKTDVPDSPLEEYVMIAEKLDLWIQSIEDQSEARGKAQGKAEGILSLLKKEIADGERPLESTRNSIHKMMEDGIITKEIAGEVLRALG